MTLGRRGRGVAANDPPRPALREGAGSGKRPQTHTPGSITGGKAAVGRGAWARGGAARRGAGKGREARQGSGARWDSDSLVGGGGGGGGGGESDGGGGGGGGGAAAAAAGEYCRAACQWPSRSAATGRTAGRLRSESASGEGPEEGGGARGGHTHPSGPLVPGGDFLPVGQGVAALEPSTQ